jgi:hypothetical protein
MKFGIFQWFPMEKKAKIAKQYNELKSNLMCLAAHEFVTYPPGLLTANSLTARQPA